MLKAYKCGCGDDDHGMEVVFAETSQQARQRKSSERCDCPYIELTAVRAKDFDSLSPGPVSIEQYLERGWYWNCQGCECQIWDDMPRVLADGTIFCGPECAESHLEKLEKWCANGDAHESCVKSRDNLRAELQRLAAAN